MDNRNAEDYANCAISLESCSECEIGTNAQRCVGIEHPAKGFTSCIAEATWNLRDMLT